ncbi:NAD-dependent epimerase/dehydratase family protein [Solirubrobacter sp. CPCC 204708]|uniref:NAD-dependent epimerase/dehydratase family protein n=1 Tax=Solirubrobacter deserti TaxID=2282478 RepID=A0ABT4RBJ8_9ACTN|nr:NAD-dependent epimerase/dehydratase family protein [Solirubrobacter deserti]MBE2317200.1 NAD-dependent epimerase/dehydratase family protein [Solirubrobacter deserti]MDA0135907.1 NAD-dependent epimerase/dehydratase family protein [Solirubrobacter deserti]
MKLLVLGGTVFLGRHVVNEALARGHEVTIYSRGLHGTPHPDVEQVIGDRADVTPLRGRAWDAAIDTSGMTPAQLRGSASLDLGHYVFVSSCNVYPDWPERPVDEDSRTWQDGEGYGQDKAASERVGSEAMDGRFATVRAGLIVGRHDNIFRLPWWVRRIAQGGRVPAPGAPDRPIQIIDARDLAAFCLRLAEERTSGAFNGTGPIGQTTWGELLAAAGDAELVWIPDEQLVEAKVQEWTELPMWLPADAYPGTWRIGTANAQAAGLTTRPVADTVEDIREWLQTGGEREIGDYRAELRPPDMSSEREAALLQLV